MTGGNTGLGQAFPLALAKAGPTSSLQLSWTTRAATRQLIEAEGRRAEVLTVDVTTQGAPKAVVDGCVARFANRRHRGKLSRHLQASASVDKFQPEDEWDPMVALNLTAAFELAYEACKVIVVGR